MRPFMPAMALLSALSWLSCTSFAADAPDRWRELAAERDAYRKALADVRAEYGGTYRLPAVDFFLFGMGGRAKFLYAHGELRHALSGKVVRSWDVAEEIIVPPGYTVAIKTREGKTVFIVEDESAVWIEADGQREALTMGRSQRKTGDLRSAVAAGSETRAEPKETRAEPECDVELPDFTGLKHRLVLRVLHQELLVNVVDGRPVPNLFVYPKPWYRDGAMMAMVFEKTQNLGLIKDWIMALREPYDRNNAGETEADNLGQALYLVSLVSDKSHPLVPLVQKELVKHQTKGRIEGRSDFALHPVYQTKWAKFGLKALGLDDPYHVPQTKDSYAALFWWAYKADDAPGQPILASDKYPYLTWAAHHYAGAKGGKLSDRDYPLTWEADASQARYEGMGRVSPEYVKRRLCAPHTWHAAEAFLSLLEVRE